MQKSYFGQNLTYNIFALRGHHVHLKNEFMEDEKYHNLMNWLKWCSPEKNMGKYTKI